MEKPTIHTLWTGGLDSTARVVFLSRQPGISIQPYYIIDSSRASSHIEMSTMKRITERLRTDAATKAELLDLKIINVDDIAPDAEITGAWRRLNEKYGVGSQYDWLARYAKEQNIVLELGVEKGDNSHANKSITAESRMVPVPENSQSFAGYNFFIDRALCNGDAWTLYRYFTFPLWETTKADEIALMQRLGCGDVVEMTWFCHAPLFGRPCGHCNPCKDAYHYNLGWRIPRINWYLWYLVRPKDVLRSIYRKIRKLFRR